MIHVTPAPHHHILILHPQAVEAMLHGRAVYTPCGSVALGYSHDIAWISQQIVEARKLRVFDPSVLETLLHDGINRPELPMPGLLEIQSIFQKR